MLMQKLGNKGPVIKILLYLLFMCLSNFVFSQTSGIANKYIGDKGIKTDPDVIFAENFEEGSINAVVSRWSVASNKEGMSLVPDVPPQSSGKSSLLITSIGEINNGGYLLKKYPNGLEKIYFRWYVKYTTGGKYHHAGSQVGGETTPPGGGFFRARAEVADLDFKHRMDLYVYWPHRRGGWGNTFINDPNVKQVPDKWMCMEMMLKLNTPVTSYNGELAMWIDGKLIIHLREGFPKGYWKEARFYPDETKETSFEGFQWRLLDTIKIDFIRLENFIERHGENPLGYVGKLWFDDVVLAKNYIGPINTNTSSISRRR